MANTALHTLVLVLSAFSALEPSSCEGKLFSVVESGWKKFWQFSCAYSSVLPRSKRSLLDPLQLDLDDPDAIFQFLYPSAKETRESLEGQGRSAPHFQQRSLTSWMNHITDIWHSECFRGNHEEPTSRNDDGDSPQVQPMDSSTPPPEVTTSMTTPHKFYNASTLSTLFNPANMTMRDRKDERTGAIVQAIINATPPPLSKQQDKWFAVYGGDIEYFYPLISFGIPFDGEVTFIGFHGFKGLFPY